MLPDYLKKPSVFCRTDDIHRGLWAAPEPGLKVLQEATEPRSASQGWFDLAAGYIVELGQRVGSKEQSL